MRTFETSTRLTVGLVREELASFHDVTPSYIQRKLGEYRERPSIERLVQDRIHGN